jgi:RNA polymerase sigma factor (TIGR02999 family)
MKARPGVTELLDAYREGDGAAFDRLVALVYDDLRRLARRQRSGGGRSPTLDTTALVHEAYLKLASAEGLSARDRAHFLAVAGRAMRQILVDYARGRTRAKRGGGAAHLELEDRGASLDPEVEWVLVVEEALGRLPVKLVRIVECRHFAGMSEEETAEALDLSLRTVQRGWAEAKASMKEILSGR